MPKEQKSGTWIHDLGNKGEAIAPSFPKLSASPFIDSFDAKLIESELVLASAGMHLIQREDGRCIVEFPNYYSKHRTLSVLFPNHIEKRLVLANPKATAIYVKKRLEDYPYLSDYEFHQLHPKERAPKDDVITRLDEFIKKVKPVDPAPRMSEFWYDIRMKQARLRELMQLGISIEDKGNIQLYFDDITFIDPPDLVLETNGAFGDRLTYEKASSNLKGVVQYILDQLEANPHLANRHTLKIWEHEQAVWRIQCLRAYVEGRPFPTRINAFEPLRKEMPLEEFRIHLDKLLADPSFKPYIHFLNKKDDLADEFKAVRRHFWKVYKPIFARELVDGSIIKIGKSIQGPNRLAVCKITNGQTICQTILYLGGADRDQENQKLLDKVLKTTINHHINVRKQKTKPLTRRKA